LKECDWYNTVTANNLLYIVASQENRKGRKDNRKYVGYQWIIRRDMKKAVNGEVTRPLTAHG